MSLALPADKSLAHRALLLAAVSARPSVVEDAGQAADVRATVACLRALGAVLADEDGSYRVGPLRPPRNPPTLDCGNSGTTARLLAGLLAGQGITATLVGDASLSRRPMARVAQPVNALFGSPALEVSSSGTLPLVVRSAPLASLPDGAVIETRVPSAQVKSAVLLAALSRAGTVVVREPTLTRDHTERLLRALGVSLVTVRADNGGDVRLSGPVSLEGGWSFRVPRDPSALALLAVAALGRGRPLEVEEVGINPTRTAFLDVLARMGAMVDVEERELRLGEPVGRVALAPPASGFVATRVDAAEAASVIDEIPALAALATLAEGTTRFEGVGELRVKESDRLSGIALGLSRFGARARVEGDALVVEGGAPLHAGPLEARGDHRLEMALLALAAAAKLDVEAPSVSWAHVSFPGFADALRAVVGFC